MAYGAVFIDVSCRKRTPCPLRHPPVNAFQQHRQLCRCGAHLAFSRRRPDKAAALQTLGEQAGPLAVPPDHLDEITPGTTEDEEMPAERVLRQNLLGQSRQRVETLAHVGLAGSKPHLRMGRHRDHRPPRTRSSPHSVPLSRRPVTAIRVPWAKVISIEEISETSGTVGPSPASEPNVLGSEISTGRKRFDSR